MPAEPTVAEPVPATGPAASPWRNTIVTLVLLLVVGLVAFVVVTRDDPVDLEVSGRAIRNAGAVLAEAETVFREIVALDGAKAHEDARCAFAPPDAEGSSGSDAPQVACGPVLLGISGDDRPWVVGRARYSSGANTDEVVGRFDRFVGVAALDRGSLRRPDGKKAPSPKDLRPATAGLRDAEGRRLTGDVDVLADADRRFDLFVGDARAATTAGTRCHFGYKRNPLGQRVGDGNAWCGPVLLVDSDDDEAWARYSLTSGPKGLVTAELRRASMTSLRETTAMPLGVKLWRPDGAKAASATGVTPPDAPAKAPQFIAVLAASPPGVDFTSPADGRLTTPARVTTFDGLARTRKIGTGADALVAAPGEEFVVARFARSRPEGAASGNETAVVVAGELRIPLPRWSALPDAGVLVVSVPASAADVALEVLFAGRAQSISLVTGARSADAPAALYRAVSTVGLGHPIDLAVTLPEEQVVRATGALTAARLDAWRRDEGWAPAGQAFLAIGVDDWSATRPCCRVTRVEPEPLWRLTLPDGAVVEAAPSRSTSSARTPLFVVPEGFTEGTLELTVRVRYVHSGSAGEAVTAPLTVAVRLPG